MRPLSFASRALIWTTLGMCAVALLATTSDAADTAGTTTAFITFKDRATDMVGYGRPAKGPDGRPDAHFRIALAIPAAVTVTEIVLWQALSTGTGQLASTDPTDVASNELAVVRGGKRLNPGDGGLSDQLPPGTTVYDVYSDDWASFKAPEQLAKVFAIIKFAKAPAVQTKYRAVSSDDPPATPPGGGTPVAPPPPSSSPNTRTSRVPDFWVGLSSDKPAVIVGDTLGIGSDGALTVATSNEQLLTIHVFERATGCLIQGAWVELWDPHGKLWSPANRVDSGFRTRFQSRAGLAYMGGLKLTEPGLYHLWVYAQNAQGKVVTQAWLPLQVKDRKGKSFVTVNGRPFAYEGTKWVERTRAPASAFSTRVPRSVAGNLFSDMYTAFQNLLSGITNGAQQLFSKGQISAASKASALLGANSGNPSSPAKLQKEYRTVDLLPSFLVSGLVSPDHPRLQSARVLPDPKARLIGQDGTSLIGQDGTSIVGQDGTSLIGQDGTSLIGQDGTSIVGDAGASLIMNDRGRLVAAGGNIVATDGATAVGNSHGNIVATDGATLSPRAVSSAHAVKRSQPLIGACALGYKAVGKGMTKLIAGTRVLARDDGTLVSRTLVIGGRNAMPVNAPAPS